MHRQTMADEAALLQLNQQRPKQYHWLSYWGRCHRQALSQAMRAYVAEPFTNFFTIGVIAVAFALPLILFTLLLNVNVALQGWHGTPKITLYLSQSNSQTAPESLIQSLQGNQSIQKVTYISPAEGMQQLESQDGQTQATFAALDHNPLPGVMIITPTHAASTPVQLHTLSQQLSELNQVASVQMNETWVKRLYYLGQTLERLVVSVGCLFGVALIFIMGNTIRLDMQKHAHEIRVLRLIGANNGFIRRPLIYQALLLGISACALAFVICGIVLHALNGPLSRLALTYHSNLGLHPVPPQLAGLVLVLACLLSYLGARIAIAQHLRK